MSSRLRFLIAGAVAGTLLVPFAAQAAPNDLDSSFGVRGVVVDDGVVSSYGEDGNFLMDVRLLADGRIVALESVRCESMGCRSFRVTRYTVNGEHDPSLIRRGPYPIDLDFDGASRPDKLTGFLVTPDGAMRLGYIGGDNEAPPWLPRHLDPNAPSERPFLLSVPPEGALGTATALPWRFVPVAAMADGGTLGLDQRTLALLTAHGTPDPSFGIGGQYPIPGDAGGISGVAAGQSIRVSLGDPFGVGLLQFVRGADGWSTATTRVPIGRPSSDSGRWDGPGGLSVAPSGHSLVWRQLASGKNGPIRETVAASFGPDGTVDRPFGNGRVLRIPGHWALTLQPDGKIVAIRRPADKRGQPLTRVPVRRFNADGSPDPSFPATWVSPRGTKVLLLSARAMVDARGRIVVASHASRGPVVVGSGALVLMRLRGGDTPALRLASPKRLRPNALRVVATSSVAGRARIVVRQAGRVVGAKSVRFTRGSRQTVTMPLRGARAKRPLAVRGTLTGTRAAAVRVVAVR